MNIEISKMAELYDNLGNNLIKNGRIFKKKAFELEDIKLTKSTWFYISSYMRALGFSQLYNADGTYYMTSIGNMRKLIERDWTDRRKYLKERYDCDNFAESFKEHMSSIYGINSVGLAKHIRTTLSTGQKIAHRACVFLATENDVIKLYLLETQNDNMIKIRRNEEIKLGRWKYILNLLEF